MKPRLLAAAAALALSAPAALAYEHVTTQSKQAARWTRACVPWWLHEGPTAGLPRPEVGATLRDAFAAWNGVEASFVRFQERGVTCVDGTGADARLGRENVVVFRDAWPYTRNVVALTSLTYDTETGAIMDADVEFNAEGYDFATDGTPTAYDLRLVMMHEAGHMLGLEHSTVSDAVMFRDARAGERAPDALHPDDEAGVVATHPVAASPGACDPAAPVATLDDPHCPAEAAPDDGCAGGRSPRSPFAWALGLSLVALGARSLSARRSRPC